MTFSENNPYRVLVIEDSEEWQKRLRGVLEGDLGYDVESAMDYVQAIETLKSAQKPFDLVTVDLDLSGGLSDDDDDDFDSPIEESELPGVNIVRYIYENHRGEVCVVASGESFTVGESLEGLFGDATRIVADMYPKAGRNRLKRQHIQMKFPEYIKQYRKRYQKIFLSYRRTHSDFAARIRDRVIETFLPDNIFFDYHSIVAGSNFKREIRKHISECETMLVIIGQDWLEMTDADGNQRIHNDGDWVRIEIAEALEQGLRVIPVLTHGVNMPGDRDLPPDLVNLAYCQAVEVRNNHRFDDDVKLLIEQILL